MRLLVRDASRLERSVRQAAQVEVVVGDLAEPSTYERSLEGCDVVVHLAATTGKASRGDYHRVNAEGTRLLVAAAGRAGVRGFLHVSSVAVKFEEQKSYWYAHSKMRSEQVLRDGGVPYVIVRPTMILGPGAPLLESLGKLAAAPVVVVFGDGSARVQPVFVDDLVARMLELVETCRFDGDTIDVGGADVVSIEELLQRLRVAGGGRRGRVLHLPLRPLRAVLAMLEPLLLPALPLTAGQLATFANDGTASVSPRFEQRPVAGLAQMLGSPPPPALGDSVVREGRKLGRYLGGVDPGAYVLSKYADFHARRPALAAGLLDRTLLWSALRVPLGVRLADVYSARLHKNSVLRRKLVLMLALLECTPPSSRVFDRPVHSGRVVAAADLVLRAAVEAIVLVTAMVVFGPVHALSWLRRRARPEVVR